MSWVTRKYEHFIFFHLCCGFVQLEAFLRPSFKPCTRKSKIWSTYIANISPSQRSFSYIPSRTLCDIHSCTRRWAYCPGLHRPPCQHSLEEVEGSSERQPSVITMQLKGSLFSYGMTNHFILCISWCFKQIYTHRWTKRHHGRPGRGHRSMTTRLFASSLGKRR